MPGITFHFPRCDRRSPSRWRPSCSASLAAILPARRAARLKVIEALIYE